MRRYTIIYRISKVLQLCVKRSRSKKSCSDIVTVLAKMAFGCSLMFLGAILATTSSQLSEKVILHQIESSGCPGDTVTLQCSVQSMHLEWRCDSDTDRFVYCGSETKVQPILCQNRTVNITRDNCDGTVLISSAKFIVSSKSTTLTCGLLAQNKTILSEQKTKTIPVQPPPVKNLHYTMESADGVNFRIVNISWNETTSGQHGIYNLTLEPCVPECNSSHVTDKTYMKLKLATSTAYNVTVITSVCNGSLQSTISEPLLIFLDESTPGGTDKELAIALSMISLVLLVAVLLLVIIPLGITLRTVLSRMQQDQRTVQEQETTINKYQETQDAFEKSEFTTGRSPLKVEAGRSVVCGDHVYFAPYSTETMLRYSLEKNKWKRLKESMRYSNPGLAIIKGNVAAIGGLKGRYPTREVWLWKDPVWEKSESMIHRRSDPAVVTSSDNRYVVVLSGNVGTTFNISTTRSIEVYNVEENTWKSVCPLPSPHTRLEVTLCDDTLYVYPDQYTAGYKCSLSALTEDPNPEWKNIRGTPLRLSTPATLEGCVICVGGADHESYGLDEIYIYDDTADSWNKVNKNLQWSRMYSMVEVHEKKVIIVGGLSQLVPDRRTSDRLDKVEIFDLNCSA